MNKEERKGINLQECEVMIFKNEKGTYKIGMSKKDRNNQYFNGYLLCKFKKGVEIENKTKIKIKNAFISFYLNDKETIPYIMITEYEKVEVDKFQEALNNLKPEDYEELLPF